MKEKEVVTKYHRTLELSKSVSDKIVQQWEVTKESPLDQESDQEDEEDEESLSEVNCKADWMEFIRDFQDAMNQAIEQLLNKSARRHSHQKDKPEPRMEQGKHKETICKEAETVPPRNVSRESDDERNSRALLETMDTDWCIQKLVKTELESSEYTQCKIEERVQYWVVQEKKQRWTITVHWNWTIQYPIRGYNNCTLKIKHKKWLTKLRDKQAQWDEPWRISEG